MPVMNSGLFFQAFLSILSQTSCNIFLKIKGFRSLSVHSRSVSSEISCDDNSADGSYSVSLAWCDIIYLQSSVFESLAALCCAPLMIFFFCILKQFFLNLEPCNDSLHFPQRIQSGSKQIGAVPSSIFFFFLLHQLVHSEHSEPTEFSVGCDVRKKTGGSCRRSQKNEHRSQDVAE